MIDIKDINLKFDDNGLIPTITQDFQTKEVLMFAFMNEEAFIRTKETGKVHYFSRSRNKLWLKGEQSEHFQYVKNIMLDCDSDCILILVEQVGGACHTGHKSCFYRDISGNKDVSAKVFKPKEVYKQEMLPALYNIIVDRKNNPKEGSYTNYLLDKGIDKTLKKVGEETTEVVIACKNEEKDEIVYEISDLMYHLSVLMVQSGVCWDDVFGEIEKREHTQL